MNHEEITLLEHVANDENVDIPTRLAAIYQIYWERGIRNSYLAEVHKEVIEEEVK